MHFATLLLAGGCTLAVAAGPVPTGDAEVTRGQGLHFARDYGSHPEFRTEWWYITGWLQTAAGTPLGFQVTFFRSRPPGQQDNPSAFAARQLLIAHAAISDPAHGHLWQDQRIRRAGLGLAEAALDDTNVWIDDWRLRRNADHYETTIAAEGFALQLDIAGTQPLLLNGAAGYSQKGPEPRSASYYYSQPQLRVSGTIRRGTHADAVSGTAWLDHEWSSQYLDPAASGWDWIGINLRDGGALMAFQIRDQAGAKLWAGATLRAAGGQSQALPPGQVTFSPGRHWRSPRTGIDYPVSWQVQVGERQFELAPLMDDQENDSRLSTGTLYWEGAVRAREHGQEAGTGYLELTGY
jgi:predicted secreted hydrolase